jgi:1,4-dihydroxy-2-naphthoate octaprenyltransferase
VKEPDSSLLTKPLLRYWLATRPAFLLASLIPACVGVAAAYAQHYPIHWGLFALTLLALALTHAGINVINDYYDHLNNTDNLNTDRIFPFTGGSRFIQNGIFLPHTLFKFGVGLLLAAIIIGVLLSYWTSWHLLVIGILGFLLGWGYSAPPLRLNSRGLGELAVALSFGVLTPLGAWLVQAQQFSWYPIVISLPLALLVMNVLYINQFPDYMADKQAGKHHWVVRLGLTKAPLIYQTSIGLALTLLLLLIFNQTLSVWSLFSVLPLGFGIAAERQLVRYAFNPTQLRLAIEFTLNALLLHGVLLTFSLFIRD